MSNAINAVEPNAVPWANTEVVRADNCCSCSMTPLKGRIKTMSSDLESSHYALSIRGSISLIGSIFCQCTQLNRPLESQCRPRARDENRHSKLTIQIQFFKKNRQ